MAPSSVGPAQCNRISRLASYACVTVLGCHWSWFCVQCPCVPMLNHGAATTRQNAGNRVVFCFLSLHTHICAPPVAYLFNQHVASFSSASTSSTCPPSACRARQARRPRPTEPCHGNSATVAASSASAITMSSFLHSHRLWLPSSSSTTSSTSSFSTPASSCRRVWECSEVGCKGSLVERSGTCFCARVRKEQA